jgi:chromate transporter
LFQQLLQLFVSFLKVGSFSFGGAYSLIPLIEREVVNANKWLSHEEFLKILGIVEVFPGAISIKFATYTGYKIGGVAGAIAANLGNIFTPAILIVTVTFGLTKFSDSLVIKKSFEGIKFAVIGMIIAIMYQYSVKGFTDWKSILFLLLGASLVIFFKLHPAFIMLIAALLALVLL